MGKEEEKKDKRLEIMIRYLRKVLKDEGLYRKEMSQQVELTASTLLVFRKIRDAALSESEEPTVVEMSREGFSRQKANPIYFLYEKMADLLRRDLRALNMNKELTKGKEDKPLDEEEDGLAMLMRDFKEED